MTGPRALHNQSNATEIEEEIERFCVALSIDWTDPLQAKALAEDCVNFNETQAQQMFSSHQRDQISKANLCILTRLMIEVMADGAEDGTHIHGGGAWKCIAREIYKLQVPLPLKNRS